jgi:hypothetical protein
MRDEEALDDEFGGAPAVRSTAVDAQEAHALSGQVAVERLRAGDHFLAILGVTEGGRGRWTPTAAVRPVRYLQCSPCRM